MRKERLFRLFLFFTLLMLIPISSLAVLENAWGCIPILGYKDPVPKTGKMFAPYAYFQDIPHVEKPQLFLEYKYDRVDTDLKSWGLWLVDKNYKQKTTSKTIRVCLPYPSIWSAKDGAHWKWTKRYAEKHYDWYYTKGRQENVFINGFKVYRFHGTPFRRVAEMNEYGLMVNLGAGFKSKTVVTHFVPAGGKVNDSRFKKWVLDVGEEEDEEENEEEEEDWW